MEVGDDVLLAVGVLDEVRLVPLTLLPLPALMLCRAQVRWSAGLDFDYYGNPFLSLLTVFQVYTLESWTNGILRPTVAPPARCATRMYVLP